MDRKNMHVRSISFDALTLREADRLARQEDRSRSSLVRRALRLYISSKGAEQPGLPGLGGGDQGGDPGRVGNK